MDNASASADTCNNCTTSFTEVDDVKLNFGPDLTSRIIQTAIGTVGVLDNLFVIIVFVFFIKIADKV